MTVPAWLSTYVVRVDTPSGRRSYYVDEMDVDGARRNIQDWLDEIGSASEIVSVTMARTKAIAATEGAPNAEG